MVAQSSVEDELRRRLERTMRQEAALLSLSVLDDQAFEHRMRHLLRVDSSILDVARVSYWSLGEGAEELRCDALFRAVDEDFEADMVLGAATFPTYFEALRGGKPIIVADAHTDPRTSEFRDAYLGPHGIGAMLDVPVYFRGQLVGVVCHEHVGPPRDWSADEQLFAMSIAQFLTLALEAKRREAVEEELRKSEARFRHMALHDPLTGLANRVLFFDLLRTEIARAQRTETYRFGVLFVDLDDFKTVNDTLGHDVGDVLLVTVAERIRSCLRATDTPARLGGDEFVAILADLKNPHEANDVGDRLTAALSAPVVVGGHEVSPSASVGVIHGDASCDDPTELVRLADAAMYARKQRRKAAAASRAAELGDRWVAPRR